MSRKNPYPSDKFMFIWFVVMACLLIFGSALVAYVEHRERMGH